MKIFSLKKAFGVFLLACLSSSAFSLRADGLSDAERSWLGTHPIIRIGTFDRDEPYAIVDADGTVSGIAPDYVKLMFEKLGVSARVEWKFYPGIKSAVKALKSGEIDLVNPFYCGEAEARRYGVVISKKVFESSMSILYRGEFTDETMSVIASPFTRLGASYVKDNYPDSKILPSLHAHDCIDHLLAGEATSVIMYTGALRTAAESYTEDFNVKSLNSLCGVAFAALPANAVAIGLIDRGIAFVDKVALNRLETRYFVAESTKVSARTFFRRHPLYVFFAMLFLFAVIAVVVVLLLQRRTALKTGAERTAFLFSMSHDIRSPMNAIMGFADIALKNADDPERVRDCMKKTKEAGNLLLSLVSCILDMSRIGSGRAKLNEVEMDVGESFDGVATTLRELADSKGVTLSFECTDINNPRVYADRVRLERILLNLTANAVKYTRSGCQVLVKCDQIRKARDGRALYRYLIADNGVGMSEEFQKNVFDQYSQEQESSESGVKGTGLGLAMCKSFAELMGGTISLRSRHGIGTTFSVELPFRVREADAEKLRGCEVEKLRGCDVQATQPPNPSTSQPPNIVGRRVLLVEDNALNREVAEFILEEEGLEVECAEDGAIAVGKVREHGPGYYDYVLMDVQMPVMNGYEATRAIRAWEREAKSLELGAKSGGGASSGSKLLAHSSKLSHLPIIALSANAFAEDRAASLAAGMDDHVAKPVKAKALMEVLAKFA